MKAPVFLLFFFLTANTIFGCCMGHQYQLFPIGMIDSNILITEVKLERYCNSTQKSTFIKGEVNLGWWKNDSFEKLKEIGQINFRLCEIEGCINPKNADSLFTLNILPLYSKALKKAKKIKGYQPVKPILYEYINDSNYQEYNITKDTVLLIKEEKNILHPSNYSLSRGYLSTIREMRKYSTGKTTLTVLNINEPFHLQDLEKIQHVTKNTERFKSLSTALTFDYISWHGDNRNYMIIESK